MFSTDKPIKKIENDLLNRASFSKELAKAVLSYTDAENFAISLCGRWGCGKTSILNMVIQEIEEESQYMREGTRPIIINFNPWNYSDKNQLITQFFKEIFLSLNKDNNNAKLKNAGSAFQRYSAIFDYAKYIPKYGEYITLLKSLIEGIGKQMTDISDDMDSIENQKIKVTEALSELEQKIIVIIDDIDRLNNEQIRLIFQLVNSVAGFPNMIYLLSFDRSVVVRALSEEQNCNGEEYLEKIIQVPFDVPEAKKEQIENVLFNELKNIVVDVHEDRLDLDYWNTVFRVCISGFINSIRDVNRIMNTYKLTYALMHTETNWVDLLCITTLKIYAPAIYNWIRDNINRLVGVSNAAMSNKEQQETRANYINEFNNVYDKLPEKMLNIMQTMFPRFSWETGGYYHNNKTAEELRYLQRIASPEYSELYFQLSLNDIKVCRANVLKSILEYDQQELSLYLQKLKKNKSLRQYLTELTCCVNRITEEKAEMFFHEILKLQLEPEVKEKQGMFDLSIESDCRYFIWLLLNNISEGVRERILYNATKGYNNEEFLVLLVYILEIEEAYGRIGEDHFSEYQVISEKALDKIEDKIKHRFKKLQTDETLLDSDRFIDIKKMWKYLNEEGFDEYMIICLSNPQNVPKYLCYVAGWWQRRDDSGVSFDESYITKYLTIEEMYAKIQQIKGTTLFAKLTDKQKQLGVAFSMWYESNNRSSDSRISYKEINKLLPEWL